MHFMQKQVKEDVRMATYMDALKEKIAHVPIVPSCSKKANLALKLAKN